MQKNRYVDEVTKILNGLDLPNSNDNTDNKEDEIETIHVYIYKEESKQKINVVDADTPKEKTHPLLFILALFIASLLPIVSIIFQVYVLLNPLIATITIYPASKNMSLKTDILVTSHPTSNEILSIPLKPVSFSQTATSLATGHGHQDANYAKGLITFYNGSSTSRLIPEGTILTGNDGVNVVTDYPVTIPTSIPTSPPIFGKANVFAHAIFTGPAGNIKAGDINTYSLGPSILAQNPYAFYGGVDARDFSIVTSSDIENALNPLKKAASQSIQTQLLLEVKTGEKLFPTLCKTKISADHSPGDEATSI
jgi:hypothetical protein